MRFLPLKLCSNKIVAGVLDSLIRPVIRYGISKTQRGFAPCRHYLDNVVDVEAVSILHSLLAGPSYSFRDGVRDGVASILLLFDVLAAFPSVSHSWIFKALAASGAPSFFIHLVRVCIKTLGLSSEFRADTSVR